MEYCARDDVWSVGAVGLSVVHQEKEALLSGKCTRRGPAGICVGSRVKSNMNDPVPCRLHRLEYVFRPSSIDSQTLSYRCAAAVLI
jgi:hypothetical protein